MKKLVFGVASAVAASTAGVSVLAFRHEDTIAPNVYVGEIMVGDLTPEEAAKKVRTWWEAEKLEKLALKSPKIAKPLPSMKPSELGITLDDVASVAQLPKQSFMGGAQALVQREAPEKQIFNPVFKATGAAPIELAKLVRTAVGKPKPARAYYRAGMIELKTETTSMELDKPALILAVIEAMERDKVLEVPLIEAPKTVPDESLQEIQEIVSSFSTRFSAGNRSRSSNLKLAASILDGIVLAPGEQFSFNGAVGQRTTRRGFKLAGVYLNGRHDVGVGGGICQVSTTLFNAALLADLDIVKRSNHSMPVPYVPVGRDATVSWGSPDLVLRNNYDFPIAFSSQYMPGQLTFRVLGKKLPGLSVKIERGKMSSWAAGVKTVTDRTLPPGRTKIVERGTGGYSVSTYRLVYQNGKLLRRDALGRSHYPGGPRIVAVGPAAPPPPDPIVEPDTF
ncbi:MAG TPA: VanW family protein [Fimbriimonas sp.]|nr:VanW family protein [Fimbriimonas sp.]